MNNILSYLNRKYPFDVLNPKAILLIGFSVAGMIYIFEPFGFINYQGQKFIAALGFGFTTIICLSVSNFLIKRSLLRWFGNKWSILKEFGYTVMVLLLISIANLYYFIILFDDFGSFDKSNLRMWLKATLMVGLFTVAIGIIPIAIIILFRYNKMLKNDLSRIIRGDEKKKDIEQQKKLTFISQNVTEKELSVLLGDFLFMEAVKNHVHIYYLDNGNVVTKSVRNTLTNLIDNLNEDALFRSHRSFLINLNKIKNTKGNSNGYKVTLHGYGNELPVSRNFTSAFQKIIY